jgi:hypothetical protein
VDVFEQPSNPAQFSQYSDVGFRRYAGAENALSGESGKGETADEKFVGNTAILQL